MSIPIIVCGGNSNRMGADKYLLNYYGKPQYLHLESMLKAHFPQVYFSIQEKQIPEFFEHKNVIVDTKSYSGHGPMSGLLSCFETFKGQSILFIGCDYPLLKLEDITKLTNDPNRTSAYFNEFFEPLLAQYSPDCFELLKSEFSTGNYSLMKFLDKINATKIQTLHSERLQSIDTPEEFQNILNKIKQSIH